MGGGRGDTGVVGGKIGVFMGGYKGVMGVVGRETYIFMEGGWRENRHFYGKG